MPVADLLSSVTKTAFLESSQTPRDTSTKACLQTVKRHKKAKPSCNQHKMPDSRFYWMSSSQRQKGLCLNNHTRPRHLLARLPTISVTKTGPCSKHHTRQRHLQLAVSRTKTELSWNHQTPHALLTVRVSKTVLLNSHTP